MVIREFQAPISFEIFRISFHAACAQHVERGEYLAPFLRTPTSTFLHPGLDSLGAYVLMDAVKRVRNEMGIACVCTIHQPSKDLFLKFDRSLPQGLERITCASLYICVGSSTNRIDLCLHKAHVFLFLPAVKESLETRFGVWTASGSLTVGAQDVRRWPTTSSSRTKCPVTNQSLSLFGTPKVVCQLASAGTPPGGRLQIKVGSCVLVPVKAEDSPIFRLSRFVPNGQC